MSRKLKTKLNNNEKQWLCNCLLTQNNHLQVLLKAYILKAQKHIYQKNGKRKSCLPWFVLTACTKYTTECHKLSIHCFTDLEVSLVCLQVQYFSTFIPTWHFPMSCLIIFLFQLYSNQCHQTTVNSNVILTWLYQQQFCLSEEVHILNWGLGYQYIEGHGGTCHKAYKRILEQGEHQNSWSGQSIWTT